MERSKRGYKTPPSGIDIIMLTNFMQGITDKYPKYKRHYNLKKEVWKKTFGMDDYVHAVNDQVFSGADTNPVDCLLNLPKKESSIYSALAIKCIDAILRQDVEADASLINALTKCVVLQRPVRRVNHSLRSVNSVETVIHAQALLLKKSQDNGTIARTVLQSFATELIDVPLYEHVLIIAEAMRVLSVTLSMDPDVIKKYAQVCESLGDMREILLHNTDVTTLGSVSLTKEELCHWQDAYHVYQAWQKPVSHCRTVIDELNSLHYRGTGLYLARLLYLEHRDKFRRYFKNELHRIEDDVVRDEILLLFCGNCDFYLDTAQSRFICYLEQMSATETKMKALICAVQRMERVSDLDSTLRYLLALKNKKERIILIATLLYSCDIKIESLLTNQRRDHERYDIVPKHN
ncbi:MAG: hypothetical protein KC662_00940 [Candidatus Magasanikbacteria bacterium]|nr:hypothetical protein [Candidatus Magasanikbacteria bacterium]